MKHLGFASVPSALQYLRYAEKLGINTEAAIKKAGIRAQVLANENGRIKGEQFQALIHALLTDSEDELFGLHSSRFVQPASYSVLGYITLHCATIGEAIERIPPFEKLVGDMGVTSIKRFHSHIELRWHCAYSNPLVRQHMIDNVLASWTLYARWLAQQQAAPARILLERPKPGQALIADYQDIFACTVDFDQTRNCIQLPAKLLDLPLKQANSRERSYFEQDAQARIEELGEERLDFSIRVASAIREQLKMGQARKELVASEFAMTERTLQRKLAAEGSSYQRLLDEERVNQAKYLLHNTSLSMQEIAYNLGYADERCFYRQFRKLNDCSPGSLRRIRPGRYD